MDGMSDWLPEGAACIPMIQTAPDMTGDDDA